MMALDLIGVGSVLGGVGSLASSLFGKKKDRTAVGLAGLQREDANRWNQESLNESRRQFDANLDYATRQAQIRTADAKAAGLHPLYALGASANVSPSGFVPGGWSASIPGQAESGSLVGEGLAAMGQIASGVGRARGDRRDAARLERLANAQVRGAEARATRDQVEAMAAWAQLKRAEQKSNETRTFPAPDRERLEWTPLTVDRQGKPISSPKKPGFMDFATGRWHTRPSASAEQAEQEYGDVGGLPFQLLRLYEDLQYNMDIWRADKMGPRANARKRIMGKARERLRKQLEGGR